MCIAVVRKIFISIVQERTTRWAYSMYNILLVIATICNHQRVYRSKVQFQCQRPSASFAQGSSSPGYAGIAIGTWYGCTSCTMPSPRAVKRNNAGMRSWTHCWTREASCAPLRQNKHRCRIVVRPWYFCVCMHEPNEDIGKARCQAKYTEMQQG